MKLVGVERTALKCQLTRFVQPNLVQLVKLVKFQVNWLRIQPKLMDGSVETTVEQWNWSNFGWIQLKFDGDFGWKQQTKVETGEILGWKDNWRLNWNKNSKRRSKFNEIRWGIWSNWWLEDKTSRIPSESGHNLIKIRNWRTKPVKFHVDLVTIWFNLVNGGRNQSNFKWIWSQFDQNWRLNDKTSQFSNEYGHNLIQLGSWKVKTSQILCEIGHNLIQFGDWRTKPVIFQVKLVIIWSNLAIGGQNQSNLT